MFRSKFTIISTFFIILFVIHNNSYAQKTERGMGGGFLYHLFAAPEPDFKFENIDEIKEYETPDLPIESKEEFIKLALTNESVKEHIFLAISESHKNLGWKVYADKIEEGWIIKLRSRTTIPEYKCYFGIDENGKEIYSPIPYKGCKYYSHK